MVRPFRYVVLAWTSIFVFRAKKYMASLIKDGNGKIQMNIDQIAAEKGNSFWGVGRRANG